MNNAEARSTFYGKITEKAEEHDLRMRFFDKRRFR